MSTTSVRVDKPPSEDEQDPTDASAAAVRGRGLARRAWRVAAARPLISAVVLIVVIAAVGSALVFTGGSSSSAAAGVQTTTSLTAVSTGTVKASVSTSGTFAAADTQDVSFGSAAKITSVTVSVGEQVTQGEVLGTIATVSLNQTLAQAKATLATAKSTLASAQDDSDTTDTQLAADVAAVAAAKAAVAVAKNQLVSAALTSPVTGTVASVGIAEGASVSAGSSTDTIEVVADGSLSVELSIPLSKIDLVKVGQTAHVTVDGHTASVPARVTYVGLLNTSSSTGSSSAYTVTVELTRTVADLYDGMGAQVAIDVGTANNALVIPLSALHTTGSRQTVNVYRSGTSTPTSVTVGVVGASTVQITSGLKADQQVVLADTAEATPTSTTTSVNRGTFGGGTFGGGTGGFTGGR